MIPYTIKNKTTSYVTIPITNRLGQNVNIDLHGYLFGLLGAIKQKKENKRHALILVVGGVGDGKSSFVECMAGLDSLINGKNLELTDVAWAMDSFIKKMDSPDNKDRVIWGDEFIQAGGNRGMALTSIGNKLKIGFVTKRLKKNSYYLLADEPKEFADKLIEMCDAMIHIKSFGLMRGYFDCYTNKDNIKFICKGFKEYNKNWNDRDIKRINPDCKGKFADFSGLFLDTVEFDRLKIEETKQLEDNDPKKNLNWSLAKVKTFALWKQGMKYALIYNDTNVPVSTIKSWVPEFKKVDSTEI